MPSPLCQLHADECSVDGYLDGSLFLIPYGHQEAQPLGRGWCHSIVSKDRRFLDDRSGRAVRSRFVNIVSGNLLVALRFATVCPIRAGVPFWAWLRDKPVREIVALLKAS